jgi:hypothetical protein
MAGDWIKIEHVTPDKPEVDQMADLLDVDHDSVVGKLLRLWIWADQQSLNGHALSVTKRGLDRLTYCPGFANAMEEVGWLIVDGSSISFPNFSDHNGKTAKSRALANKRKANSRSKGDTCHAESVTETAHDRDQSVDQRREEKSIIHTPTTPPAGGGRESLFPSIETCEQEALNQAPEKIVKQYAEIVASIGRSFHGIYSFQKWRTQGGQDLLQGEAWKHKLRNHFETEIRKEIAAAGRASQRAHSQSHRPNAGGGSRRAAAAGGDAGAGIEVPVL